MTINPIHKQKKIIKLFLTVFLLSLSFGYFTGLDLLSHTTNFNVAGIEENFLGNDKKENVQTLKFKMSEKQILNIIHSHVFPLSVMFFILSSLLLLTPVNKKLLHFLIIEPFISLVLTFGGIWLMWKELALVQYIVMISGFLLHLSFLTIILILLYYCNRNFLKPTD